MAIFLFWNCNAFFPKIKPIRVITKNNGYNNPKYGFNKIKGIKKYKEILKIPQIKEIIDHLVSFSQLFHFFIKTKINTTKHTGKNTTPKHINKNCIIEAIFPHSTKKPPN